MALCPGKLGSVGHTIELGLLLKGPDSGAPSGYGQMGEKLASGNTYYLGL